LSFRDADDEFLLPRMKKEFEEAGYSLGYEVLNTKNYGVPQSRERLIIFGVMNRKKELIQEFFKNLNNFNKIMDKSLPQEQQDQLRNNFEASILYNQKVGNIYTGSLFLGLLSLLENSDSLKAGDKIALYSYGSGAVSEFFSVVLVEGFEKQLRKNRLDLLDQRQALSVADYERIFFEEANLDESGSATMSGYEGQDYALVEIVDHQRRYSKVEK